MKGFIRSITPHWLLSWYHYLFALTGALCYRFSARSMVVIGVTGTKGKSSTCEYVNAIFEAAGYKTVLISTIRSKIAGHSEAEAHHMTMPGRMVIQRTIARAKRAGCTVAIIEISSEGAVQYRDRFLFLNALIFTNLAPEHIEAHGSFEQYAEVKLGIARRMLSSPKRPRVIVANADDAYGPRFLEIPVERRLPYSLNDARPFETHAPNAHFTFSNRDIRLHFPGEFSIYNALAAATLARTFAISDEHIEAGLEGLVSIPGRAEDVSDEPGLRVIVDYAHTPESLEAIYGSYEGTRICVLGGTGGGRDTWKRPKMGAIAEHWCDAIVLTDEDPYDEDPRAIVQDVASGITRKKYEVVMDRRAAIARAIAIARVGRSQRHDATATVFITGKGSNPSICGPNGTHIPWSDAQVAREELARSRDTIQQ